MNKTSPGARAIRTFMFALAGIAGSVALIDWTTDWRAGAVVVALGVIAAAISAAIAFLQGVLGWTVHSAWTRAVVTFAQVAAAGLGTIVVTQLTADALANAGQAAFRIMVGAVVAAIAAYAQNAVEGQPAAP